MKFIDERFEGSSFKDLSDFTSENFKKNLESIESMDAKEAAEFKVLKGIKKRESKIIASNCDQSNTTCEITYYVSYADDSSGKRIAITDTKKIATLIKIDEKWKIEDIKHIKTFHEMKEVLGVGDKGETQTPPHVKN